MGGGGHITLAGAQLEGLTMEEAKTELIIRINESFNGIFFSKYTTTNMNN